MSGVVPQVAAMVGPGAAGTAYIPGLADFVPMVKNIGSMALAGPPLVKAVTGQDVAEQELGGYLSTANGPGSALIACRVVSGYYVEDCQFLGESPQGSQIGRAVMAASWQFRVRPARIGGAEQFGTWVRIRIDYTVRRAKP
jgi:protein TonB